MLQFRESRIIRQLPDNLVPGVIVHEEGIPMSLVKQAGVTYVQIAQGNAGEIFAGVSLARNTPPAILPMVEQFAAAATSKQLARLPITGQIFVSIDGAGVATSTSAASGTNVQLVGDTLTFDPAFYGKVVTVQYQYAPSVEEARLIVGQAPIGGLASDSMGVIGLVKQGRISTNMFDASQDWSSATHAKLGNGVFEPATAADGIPGVVVKNSPGVDNPFLILDLNVA